MRHESPAIAWPALTRIQPAAHDEPRTPADRTDPATERPSSSIAISDTLTEAANGLVEGQEYGYRFWARWACR